MSNDEPLFDSDVDPKRIKNVADGLRRQGEFESARMLDSYAVMLAAAPQQAAEPLAWPFVESPGEIADRLKGALENGCPLLGAVRQVFIENPPLYTHPQPAQDASKYQELLMAVEKKFPGKSRHETALRYIRETELQSCEPKCDSSMAKESGR